MTEITKSDYYLGQYTVELLKAYLRDYRDRVTSWFRRTCVWKAWYWLRCHTITRYHVVDIRNSDYGYDYGYIDPREILFLAAFKALVILVEEERCFKCVSYGKNQKKVKALYRWWKVERKRDYEALAKMIEGYDMHFDFSDTDNPCLKKMDVRFTLPGEKDPSEEAKRRHDAFCAEEGRLEKKDQKMLEKLVKIREHMWT